MLVCGPTALGFRELLKPGAQVRDGAWKSAELVGLRSRLLIRHVALVDCGHLQAKNRLVLKLLRPTGMYIGSPETTRRRAQRDSAGMRREECGIACRVELCSDGMWEEVVSKKQASQVKKSKLERNTKGTCTVERRTKQALRSISAGKLRKRPSNTQIGTQACMHISNELASWTTLRLS